jgi:hypothetical protein
LECESTGNFDLGAGGQAKLKAAENETEARKARPPELVVATGGVLLYFFFP